MIFVTIGTSSWDFVRLIKEMDIIAGEINEEVIMQIGHTKYAPSNAHHFIFSSKENIEEFYKDARMIVSHAGVGSIITALKFHRPNVIIPRRKKYGEIIDDHQVDIAKKIEYENEKNIKVVWDIKYLKKTIDDFTNISFIESECDRSLVISLSDYINSIKNSRMENRI